ncbi:MAG: CYTH domain-containing protein [Akkermansiaceae bacterium]
MAIEIERKFLVVGEFPREECVEMVQGYLCREIERTVRVRIEGRRAVITVKGRGSGISRPEFEYEVPVEDAREMLQLADGPLVEKTRYYHRVGNHTWEIDVFKGENVGLIVAEIELQSEDEAFESPSWLGAEVSGDGRYANSSLSKLPFSKW